MKCIHCGGEMKLGTIAFHIDRKDCHVTLDKVPAWGCGQCGEAYFEEKEVKITFHLLRVLEVRLIAV
jgi:YgiT-type zinc finger domain-containing protein